MLSIPAECLKTCSLESIGLGKRGRFEHANVRCGYSVIQCAMHEGVYRVTWGGIQRADCSGPARLLDGLLAHAMSTTM